MTPPDEQWFQMREVRRRRLATAVWIPLRQMETTVYDGVREETVCVGSVAFFPKHRDIGERVGWSDIGLTHNVEPYAFKDGRYKPVDAYMYNDTDVVGVELIFEQHFNGDHPRRWLINQDLTIALGLIKEGDTWHRVNEGYVEVIRSRRDSNGGVIAIEIKAEFLRDYLAARGLSLRLAQYCQRMAILRDASYLPFANKPIVESNAHDRFETRVLEVDTEGAPFGGKVAIFRAWRTDVDDDEDVPVFGLETAGNTAGTSTRFERGGDKAYRIEGELWREEWIEPADTSIRVRGDRPAEDFSYIVDAGGGRLPASMLDNEDVGRYLWFRPTLIESLLHHRGAGLGWYTRQTGWVKC